ncbi:hypothetical protein M1N20_02600 [Dehalococcoidia bacterium]|nr:hypothetical protein [Dehalococcoidia bacterium]
MVGKLTLENEQKGACRTASAGFKEMANHQGMPCGVPIRWGCRLMKLAREVVYHKSRDKSPEKMEKRLT